MRYRNAILSDYEWENFTCYLVLWKSVDTYNIELKSVPRYTEVRHIF